MYYKDLLRFRQVWIGLALIWIILFHLPFNLGPLRYLAEIGYGGVDICFFASGIGCFYSLTNDSDIGNFMKRRLKKLAITYFIFIIFWLISKAVLGPINFQTVLGNIFAVQYFTGHKNYFNWYISTLFIFYIFAPYLKIIVERTSSLGKTLFFALLLICSIPFWNSDTFIIAATRITIFFIGMVFADMCQKSIRISNKHVIIATLMFVLGILSLSAFWLWLPDYLWSHGLYWYPFILITPPLCMAISYILILCEKIKIVKLIVSFLSLCGAYSFELYLVHIPLISFISLLIKELSLSKISCLIWLSGCIILFVGCFVLRWATNLCERILNRKNIQ